MSWYVFVSVVVPVPAGIVHVGSVALSHVTSMVMSPWLPADGPLIVLWISSEPGTGPYVSVRSALAWAFAAIVTCCGLPVVTTPIVLVLPSACSVTVQARPAGMLS